MITNTFPAEVNFCSESSSQELECHIKSVETASKLVFLWERDVDKPSMGHSTELSILALLPFVINRVLLPQTLRTSHFT